jgi:hypothetical protein
MKIPVEAKPAPQAVTGAEGGNLPAIPAASPAMQQPRAPSIRIDKLIVENATLISAASVRDGFREACLQDPGVVDAWNADAFRREISIDLPPGLAGRDLGRHVAEAILRRARQS